MLNETTIGALVLLLALGAWAFWDFCQKSPRELADGKVTDELEKAFRNEKEV